MWTMLSLGIWNPAVIERLTWLLRCACFCRVGTRIFDIQHLRETDHVRRNFGGDVWQFEGPRRYHASPRNFTFLSFTQGSEPSWYVVVCERVPCDFANAGLTWTGQLPTYQRPKKADGGKVIGPLEFGGRSVGGPRRLQHLETLVQNRWSKPRNAIRVLRNDRNSRSSELGGGRSLDLESSPRSRRRLGRGQVRYKTAPPPRLQLAPTPLNDNVRQEDHPRCRPRRLGLCTEPDCHPKTGFADLYPHVRHCLHPMCLVSHILYPRHSSRV
jgi:hypothetical protein